MKMRNLNGNFKFLENSAPVLIGYYFSSLRLILAVAFAP